MSTTTYFMWRYKKNTRGPWATIRSPDKNSYCISANVMLLSVLPQQLGHNFDHEKIKGHPSIIISANLVDFEPLLLYSVYQDSAQELSYFWRRRVLSVLQYIGIVASC